MCNVNFAKAWFSVISMEKSRKFVTGVKAKTLLSNFCCGENTINATALCRKYYGRLLSTGTKELRAIHLMAKMKSRTTNLFDYFN